VRSADPYHLTDYPWRLEYGTPNMMGVASLWAGQDWLDAHGIANVHRQEMALARKLVDGLRTIEGVKLYCCDNLDNHLSTILMNLEGGVRFSVGAFNTEADIAAAIAAVADIAQWTRDRQSKKQNRIQQVAQ
jgi:selenocysteine lyase/cysteine desulfurase